MRKEHHMKKAIVGLVLAAGLIGSTAIPASANTPCIARAEFRRVKMGMTLTQVKRIVGSRGRVSLSSPPIVIRDFKTCTAFHVSNITFWSGRVDGKLYI
jgi:hypothetical protein